MGSLSSKVKKYDIAAMDKYFEDFLNKNTVEKSNGIITAPVFVAAFAEFFPENIRNDRLRYLDDYFMTNVLRRANEWNMHVFGYYKRSMINSPALVFTGRTLVINTQRPLGEKKVKLACR
jgi:hypothetical protein